MRQPPEFGELRAVGADQGERGFQRAQFGVAVEHVLDGRSRRRGRFLGDVREHPARRQVDGAGIRHELTADGCEQARLARPVRTDEPDLVAIVHGQRRVVEERLRAAREHEIRDAQHQRAIIAARSRNR